MGGSADGSVSTDFGIQVPTYCDLANPSYPRGTSLLKNPRRLRFRILRAPESASADSGAACGDVAYTQNVVPSRILNLIAKNDGTKESTRWS